MASPTGLVGAVVPAALRLPVASAGPGVPPGSSGARPGGPVVARGRPVVLAAPLAVGPLRLDAPLHQGLEPMRDLGTGILHDTQELLQHVRVLDSELAVVVARDEGDCSALVPDAPRAADAVHVRVNGVREVIIDHQTYLLDVQPSCRNIGGYHDVDVALAEAVQVRLALLLREVAVQRTRVDFLLVQLLVQPLRGVLRVDEHQATLLQGVVGWPLRKKVVEHLEQLVVLVLRADLDDVLLDGVHRAAHDTHADPDIIIKKILCHLLAALRESGGEHHGLALVLARHVVLLADLPNLGLETHVQHAVRLVQHQDEGPLDFYDPAAEEVLEPARCRHHDVAALGDLLHLHLRLLAAVHAAHAVRRAVRELQRLLVDLDAQLARGRHHERVGAAGPFEGLLQRAAGVRVILHHRADDREQESRGLS
mmetsp:Transcript_90555/g.245481  ORF Transcript_90555/g.245481 Transcript_90555/m.245481 type:complete len:424 (+) Transcript_90555:106-1377(+)